MKLEVDREYVTREGRPAVVLQAYQKKSGNRDFVKMSEQVGFAVRVEGKLEKYNYDGTYLGGGRESPMDIVAEKGD